MQFRVPNQLLHARLPMPVATRDNDNAFMIGKLPQFTSRLLDGALEGLSELPRVGGSTLEKT